MEDIAVCILSQLHGFHQGGPAREAYYLKRCERLFPGFLQLRVLHEGGEPIDPQRNDDIECALIIEVLLVLDAHIKVRDESRAACAHLLEGLR